VLKNNKTQQLGNIGRLISQRNNVDFATTILLSRRNVRALFWGKSMKNPAYGNYA
jgi:hypothetical protein